MDEMNTVGTLYIVATPIGNARDMELVCTKKAGTVIERGRRIQQQFTANLFAGIEIGRASCRERV